MPVEAPAEDAFDWRFLPPGPLFEPAPRSGAGREQYRAKATGETKLVVHGDPRCLGRDGGCGTSAREWTLFAVVR